ncbi:MAG TPA: hypothetical protein VN848_07345 [Gemmatimonadales bacterium]|nr:hypothetical protein [Gemmatimonadales bacterium]
MHRLAFVLAAALGLGPPPKPLRFDLTALPVSRDSFVFYFDDDQRGWAVWQYELRTEGARQEVLYTAASDFEPSVDERMRVVVDRHTGAPVESFRHTEFTGPGDTVWIEHHLVVKNGRVTGRRIVATKTHGTDTIAVSHAVPPAAVWSSYELFAAAVTNAVPGDSLVGRAFDEAKDSVVPLTFVAEQPVAIDVPAGHMDVLPLRSSDFLRLYVTRSTPRRVVMGETLDRRFRFELAATGPVVPSEP